MSVNRTNDRQQKQDTNADGQTQRYEIQKSNHKFCCQIARILTGKDASKLFEAMMHTASEINVCEFLFAHKIIRSFSILCFITERMAVLMCLSFAKLSSVDENIIGSQK